MNEHGSYSPGINSANSRLLNDDALDLSSSDSNSLRRPMLDEESRLHSLPAIQEPSPLTLKQSLILKQATSNQQQNQRQGGEQSQ